MAQKPEKIDRFLILEKIGAGGMGIVYRALDPRFKPASAVAVKLLREGFDSPEIRERFMQEASSARRLNNQHIVTVYEVGEYQNQPYIVMEFVVGDPLDQLIKRRDPSLTLLRKLELMEGLCSGLAYAHREGVIHRDIKPPNLMVNPERPLKILDFGIARVADSDLTKVDALIGTPNYMSPEQLGRAPIDKRSDVFAVGAVFYELLTYSRAFPGSGAEAIAGILTRDPKPVSQLTLGIDPQLEQIVMRALEKDPTKRYQDLGQMGRDIVKVRERLARDDSPTLMQTVASTVIVSPRETPNRVAGSAGISREEIFRRALPAVDEARALFERGQITEALARLERFSPANELVDEALVNLRERAAELERQAQRRAAIANGLREATAHLETSQYARALEAANRVLRIDPEQTAARDVIRRAEAALEAQRRLQALDAQAEAVVREARSQFERGDRQSALSRLREFRPEHRLVTSAIAELETAHADLTERERIETAKRNAAAFVQQSRDHLERGGAQAALASARAALEILQDDPEARALESSALEMIEVARRREKHDRAAEALIQNARLAFDAGDYRQALQLLADFSPAHPSVSQALSELQRAFEIIEREREDAEKQRTFDIAMSEVRQLMDSGNLSGALERLNVAARIIPLDERVESLRGEIDMLTAAAEERRRLEANDRLAREQVTAARQLFANGSEDAAIALLERSESRHLLVENALREMRAKLTERVHEEAERRRLEEKAREAEIEAAHQLAQRRTAEERQRQEERRREEERQQRREQVVKWLETAEQELQGGRASEAILLLKRADEWMSSVADVELQRRAAVAAANAELLDRERREEVRKREEDERKREQALGEIFTLVAATGAHQDALDLLNKALTLAPDDARVQRLIQERRKALAYQQAEEKRQQEAAAQREQEARKREEILTEIIARARKAETPALALSILKEAQDLAPADQRVRTLISEYRETLELERERERIAQRQRAARAAEERRRRRQEGLAAILATLAHWSRNRRLQITATTVLVLTLGFGGWQFLAFLPSNIDALLPPPPPSRHDTARGPTSVDPPTDMVGGTSIGGSLPLDRPMKDGSDDSMIGGSRRRDQDQPTQEKAGSNVSSDTSKTDSPASSNISGPGIENPGEGRSNPPSTTAGPPTVARGNPAPAQTPDNIGQSTPRKPDTSAERAAIQQLLREYVDAYNRLAEERLKQIDPNFRGIPGRSLLRSVELTVGDTAIEIADDGQSATLRASQRFNYKWRRDELPPTGVGQLFWRLRKTGTAWVVVP